MNVVASPAPDLAAIKRRQQGVWSVGDYPVVGTTLQIVGEQLAESLDLRPGERVLDIAAGNGNATLAAARRFCDVVSTDYVGAWLRNGMERAEAERLPVAFREADAEDLPFADASFDVVTSTFGVMFTANQEAAAAEMIRVCRPGGRIGMANWTPDGFIGRLFKTIGRHAPPPAGLRPAVDWGTTARIEALFDVDASQIAVTERDFVFRYRSARHWVELWRAVYGPMQKAFETAGQTGNVEALEADLIALAEAESRAGAGAMIVPGRYLEIIVRRR
ncbi:MAG: methyltransferase domain-containing protein [Sneathiellaceae bacterium]